MRKNIAYVRETREKFEGVRTFPNQNVIDGKFLHDVETGERGEKTGYTEDRRAATRRRGYFADALVSR